jgi:PPOX class probable F420-dependent enzyme
VATHIPQAGRALLDGRQFATIATVQRDGRPQLSVVWVARDGDQVLVSTVEGRQKHRNLLRDRRVSLLVFDAADPYAYLAVSGTAEMTRDGGRELIDELAAKYRGVDRYTGDDGTDNVRVVVRITPTTVVSRPR